MVLRKLDSDMQKNELGPLFLHHTIKINSKWMKGLNIRQEAIKILEEKASKNLTSATATPSHICRGEGNKQK